MPLFEWTEEMNTGVDLIDADHKLLVSLINQLHDAREKNQGADVVGSVLNVLYEYTDTHFKREELLMEKGGYPDLAEHRKKHDALTAQVHDIAERFNKGDPSAAGQELEQFLTDWLKTHILGTDMKYRPYVEGVTLSPEELMRTFNLELDDDDQD